MTLLLPSRRAVVAGGLASLAAFGAKAQTGKAKDVSNITMVQGTSGLVIHEMAISEGFFDDFNIEPNLLKVADGTKTTAAVLSGAVDICMWSGFNQIPPAIEKGGQMKILAGSLNLPPISLYSSKKDVVRVEDLVGKIIGIGPPGAVMHQMLVLLLKKHGITADQVQWRNVGSTPDIFKAVVAGTVDAGVAEVDFYERQDFYGVHSVKDGELWTAIPEYTNQATYASDASIAAKRELLVRTLAVYAKAYRFASGPNSRNSYIKARKVVTGQEDPQEAITYWNFIQKNQPYDTDLVLSDERLTFVQQLNVEFNVQSKVLPVSQIADMSLARDAVKLLG